MVIQADQRLGVHLEAVVDVQEELEAELVGEVNLVEQLDGEVDGGAGGRQGKILPGGVLDVRHNLVRLVNLPPNLRSLSLQRLQGVDHIVVVEDPALGFVVATQQVLLEVSQPQLELSL